MREGDATCVLGRARWNEFHVYLSMLSECGRACVYMVGDESVRVPACRQATFGKRAWGVPHTAAGLCHISIPVLTLFLELHAHVYSRPLQRQQSSVLSIISMYVVDSWLLLVLL
jgi:hypothetical protein